VSDFLESSAKKTSYDSVTNTTVHARTLSKVLTASDVFRCLHNIGSTLVDL